MTLIPWLVYEELFRGTTATTTAMALLASSIVGVILLLSSSSAAAAAASFSASSLSHEEAKRYANLPPTVFSPTGRLFGVERVAHEAAGAVTPLSYDNKDASKKNNDHDDGEMTYSSCFALTCRRRKKRRKNNTSCPPQQQQQEQQECSIDKGGERLLIATTNNLTTVTQPNEDDDDTINHVYNDYYDDDDYDDYDEFAVMVGIGPQSPYLYQDHLHHRNNNVNDHNSSSDEKTSESMMIAKTTTKSIIDSPIPHDIIQKYQPLLINNNDDDDDDDNSLTITATSSSAPIAILSSHLLIGSGGKAVDSTILLHRAIEMALSLYTSSDGGLLNFISHYLNDNDDGRIQSGGVEGVHASILTRKLADMAQSSTQTLSGRYGRMLSSSLLVLGTQQLSQQQHRKQQHRRGGNDNDDNNDDDDDRLILWRIDPTGQFYKVIASGIGRGGIYAELELMMYVRRWKRGVLHKQQQLLQLQQQETSPTAATTTILTRTMEEQDQDEDNDEDNEGIVITTNDVRSYLGTLTPNDAIELATDCLVNGIIASASTMEGRGSSTINSHMQQHQQRWHDEEDKNDVLSLYKEEVRQRVHAVIIHS